MTYLWNFGDGNTSNEPSPSHEYQEGGTYDVSLIVFGVCGSDTTTQSIMVSPTSVFDSQDLVSKIEIYPNPTNGNFTVGLLGELSNQDVKIKLIDIVGKEIMYMESERNSNLSIDATDIPKGIFFLEVSYEHLKISKKIVIQ